MERKISISYKSILLGILTVLGIFVAYELRSILIVLFIAFIINAGLRPIVDALSKLGVRRGVAILITYLLIFLVFGTAIAIIFNTAIQQIIEFIETIQFRVSDLQEFFEEIPIIHNYIDYNQLTDFFAQWNLSTVNPERIYDILLQAINIIGVQGLSIVGAVVGFLFTLLLVIFLSIYMLQDKKNVYDDVLGLFPNKYSTRLLPVFVKIEHKLGYWLLGQAVLMLAIGAASYVALQIPRFFDPNYETFKFALVIAIIAALFEAIPNIGPTLTLVFAIFIAILSGASIGIVIYIVIAFIAIQQLESLFLTPRVMKRAIDVSPIMTIAGITAGFQIGGALGGLLAVPFIGVVQIIINELSNEWKKTENNV